MLSFEAYRMRMETGLSFIEFNYQLLQSYDFLQLFRRHGCRLQIGGDDQWGNIVAGIELVRRTEGAETYGLTFPLVTTSDGKKMGKTEKGALFLDPAITSPYEFFQYWRNVPDGDVGRFLLMFTFLPVEECESLAVCTDAGINKAKERLAWEVTALIHGREEADKAMSAARAAFGVTNDVESMPTVRISANRVSDGIGALDLFVEAGLVATKSEARRLVQQGGASVGDQKIVDEKAKIPPSRFGSEQGLVLRAGKKRIIRVVLDS
jgi:tyrosyl-tRNA synthetase